MNLWIDNLNAMRAFNMEKRAVIDENTPVDKTEKQSWIRKLVPPIPIDDSVELDRCVPTDTPVRVVDREDHVSKRLADKVAENSK